MPRLSSYVVCPRCRYKIPQHKHFTNQIKEDYAKAFSPWKPEDDQRLMELVAEKASIPSICNELQRQPSAIKRRIELLSYTVAVPEVVKPAPQNWEAQETQELERLKKESKDARPARSSARPAARQHTS